MILPKPKQYRKNAACSGVFCFEVQRCIDIEM